ncbi:hypothetical protein GXW82_00295 [Streptacidiphilus sp. 4-A2]|nr:hypothetical protein [Streptacidiphilus sp. 4-A2]
MVGEGPGVEGGQALAAEHDPDHVRAGPLDALHAAVGLAADGAADGRSWFSL